MAEENKGRDFVTGLIVGAVVGSVLTFWLAGRMRRQLRERGIDLGGSLGELGALVREKGDEFLARAREIFKQAVEEGKEASAKARSELESKFGEKGE